MKNRTIHELLIILRDYILDIGIEKSFFGLKQRMKLYSGLCRYTVAAYRDYRISEREYELLKAYIAVNRPEYISDPTYGWKPYIWKPRLKWLNKHIKLTKLKNV